MKTRAAKKQPPFPVRLDPMDGRFLNQAAFDTGLSVSELLRRSVRLMRQQKQISRGYGFIVELTA